MGAKTPTVYLEVQTLHRVGVCVKVLGRNGMIMYISAEGGQNADRTLTFRDPSSH